MFMKRLACKFTVKWIVREADIKNSFLRNTLLRPLVKITINVSKKTKERSAYKKKNCRSAKAHVPSRFLKQFRSFCETPVQSIHEKFSKM